MREGARAGEDMEDVKRLSCEEATRQFFAYLDRALEGEDVKALEGHLQSCLDCCERLEFSHKLDAFVTDRLEQQELPKGLEDRIRKAMRR